MFISFSNTAYALPEEIDATIFTGEVHFQIEVILTFISLLAVLVATIKIRAYFYNMKVKKDLVQYQKKKALTKMSSMHASELVMTSLITIAKEFERAPEDLLADNELFEKAFENFKALYPGHPITGHVQQMRHELHFVFSNPHVKFLISPMLQPKQVVRVFGEMEERNIAFMSKVIRCSDKQLWLEPPKVKGRYLNISRFPTLTVKCYRSHDGEFSFEVPLKTQIESPTAALVLGQTDQIMKFEPNNLQPIGIEGLIKFVFMVEQMEEITIFKKYDPYPCLASVISMSQVSIEIAAEGLPKEAHLGCYVLFKMKKAGITEKITGRVFDISVKHSLHHVKIEVVKLSEVNRLLLENYVHKQTTV